MSAIRNFWADRRGKTVLLLVGVLLLLAIAATLLRFENKIPPALVPEGEFTSRQQPHRAVYDLSLGRMKSGGEVQDISGRMVAEWRGGPSCGGYSSEQRVVTRVVDTDGNLVSDDTRVATWESADGQEFHFDRAQYVNGELSQQEGGAARRGQDGKHVILEKGEEKPIRLPDETIFPAEFNLRLMTAAEKGENTISALLFDGTEDKASISTAFIGKMREPSPATAGIKITNVQFGQPLSGKKAWPIRMSYFDHLAQDSMPDFQMGYLLFANGVSAELTLEYEDVTMKATLVGIEYFKPGSC